MRLLRTSLLQSGDVLDLLREFNSEAENILAHLCSLERACLDAKLDSSGNSQE